MPCAAELDGRAGAGSLCVQRRTKTLASFGVFLYNQVMHFVMHDIPR